MISQKLASITIAIAVIATVIVVLGHQDYVVAEEKEKHKFADNVAIHTVFTFRQGVEESDSFQVFTQKNGFDRVRGSAEFELRGTLDTNRMILYDAADTTFYRGLHDQNHDYAQFDVDVYLHRDGTTLRQFHYEDCRVVDYHVITEYDKEEGWMGKGFAVEDKFKFQCNGYQPVNSLTDLAKTNGFTAPEKTMSSSELKDTSSWSPSFRK